MVLRLFSAAIIVFFLLGGFFQAASAAPTLQVYIDGATADTILGDENTWFNSGYSFNLFVAGAYGKKTNSISGVTLLVSVPKGERGTINFSTVDESPALLRQIGQGSTSFTNPALNADIDILSNVSGLDGYASLGFLPAGFNMNNHYPAQEEASDFLIFDLFGFDKSESGLNNYNADDGIIASTSAAGEQKEYAVNYTGFSRLHFDAYGLVDNDWEANPGSHDSTANAAPEPASLSLLGLGLLGLAGLGRKRNKP